MKKILFTAPTLVVIFFSGCSDKSDVVASPSGPHTISNQGIIGFKSKEAIRTGVFKEAAAYCIRSGRDYKVIQMDESKGPYVPGEYPSVTLKFNCI